MTDLYLSILAGVIALILGSIITILFLDSLLYAKRSKYKNNYS